MWNSSPLKKRLGDGRHFLHFLTPEAIEKIKNQKSDYSRGRESNDHWDLVRPQKETQGYSRKTPVFCSIDGDIKQSIEHWLSKQKSIFRLSAGNVLQTHYSKPLKSPVSRVVGSVRSLLAHGLVDLRLELTTKIAGSLKALAHGLTSKPTTKTVSLLE